MIGLLIITAIPLAIGIAIGSFALWLEFNEVQS